MMPVEGEAMRSALRLLNLIEHHRQTFLATPFILAAILTALYVFGSNQVRQVLDFMSPGHFFGR